MVIDGMGVQANVAAWESLTGSTRWPPNAETR